MKRSLVALLASTTAAQAAPCKDVDAYRAAIAQHRQAKAAACANEDSPDCTAERDHLSTLDQNMQACLAGQDVGPPPILERPPGLAPAPSGPELKGVFEGFAGGALAVGDSAWRDTANASPTLGGSAGLMRGSSGLLLSGEWTPERITMANAILPAGFPQQQLRRLRFVLEAVYEHRVTPDLTIGVRGGAGVDWAMASYQATQMGSPYTRDGDSVGLALEVGGSAWWTVAEGVDLGASVAVPYARHSAAAATTGDPTFQYSGADVELRVGVRVWSSAPYSR